MTTLSLLGLINIYIIFSLFFFLSLFFFSLSFFSLFHFFPLSLFFSLSLFFLSLSFFLSLFFSLSLFFFSFGSDFIELDFKEISYLVLDLIWVEESSIETLQKRTFWGKNSTVHRKLSIYLLLIWFN